MIEEINILFPLFTLLVGAFIGHRLALGRDKRKDFNQVATPIREMLISEIRQLKSNDYGKPIGEKESISLEAIMPSSTYKRFHRSYQSYKSVRAESFRNSGFGNEFVGDYKKLLISAENLLASLPQK